MRVGSENARGILSVDFAKFAFKELEGLQRLHNICLVVDVGDKTRNRSWQLRKGQRGRSEDLAAVLGRVSY